MKKTLLLLIAYTLLASCNTAKKVVYLQDVQLEKPQAISSNPSITVQPRDMISIVVSSKDPQLATLFNLPRVQGIAGRGETNSNQTTELSGYTVDNDGRIDFPVLGSIHIAGFNRKQIASCIKELLMADNLVKDPIVTVDFLNLGISVMGEVAKPGRFSINKDQVSLLEALSQAGDLTIFGKRDGVYVIREQKGQRTTYKVDLKSVDLFSSPIYYLQQNDIVYVEPNKVRANQSTVNGNTVQSVSLWISITSLLTTLGVLIFK